MRAANGGIASLLQSARLVAAVAEVGLLALLRTLMDKAATLAAFPFMKTQAPVIVAGLLMSILAGCSKTPAVQPALKVKDLGIVKVSDGILTHHDLGGSRGCVITPTILKSNSVSLAIIIQETNSAGVVQPVATTKVDIKPGKTNQISIGDNFDIRLMPQIEQ